MKKLFIFMMAALSCQVLSAQTIKATLWNGESENDVAFSANIGDNTTESVTKVATPANTVNGVYNPSANSLKMVREIVDGNDWHGIGLDVAALNLKLSDASQFSMLMMKDKSENAKVEFVCEGDKHVITKLAWHNGENKWHRLIYTLSESENYADNKDLKIEKIYIQPHTWHSEGTTDIYIDDITFGDDLHLLPYSIDAFDGFVGVKDYTNIETLRAYNTVEVGDIADKKIGKVIYTKDITADAWTLVGIPAFLGTPTSAPTASKALVAYSGSTWETGTAATTCIAQFSENKIIYTFENVTGAYNTEITLVDGYQIVACPILQNYNANALRADDQTIYTIADGKLVKNTADDIWLHSFDAVVVYKGTEAPDELPFSNVSTLISNTNNNIQVITTNNTIQVVGASDVIRVYNINGSLQAEVATGNATIEVPQGMYIVHVGNAAQKVIVK